MSLTPFQNPRINSDVLRITGNQERRSSMTSLQDILKKVPDPRSRQGLRHPHWALLSLIILSMPCGRRGMAAAHRLGKMLTPRQLRRLGFRPEHDPPSHPTLTEFTRYLDPDALAEALSALIPAGGGVDPEMARHVAIDGKTMRGTKDAGGRAVHVLSAFRPALEQCLGHESSRGKGMEIPDAPTSSTAWTCRA